MIAQEKYKNKVLLLILDGLGIRDKSLKNAFEDQAPETLKKLFENYPYTEIHASGQHVGLPDGVMGNSEVGHLNIGSGRKIKQDLVKITDAFSGPLSEEVSELNKICDQAKNKNVKIHLMGLLSDGGVHSHINHLKFIGNYFQAKGYKNLFLHAFLDGRDTPIENGIKYIEEIENQNTMQIATLQGRYWAMDRDNRWERIQKAYTNLVLPGAHNSKCSLSPKQYLKSQYHSKIYDEFIEPCSFTENGKIEHTDIIFFFNFRPDRARQLTQAFLDPSFKEFEREFLFSERQFFSMTSYFGKESAIPSPTILFPKNPLKNTLSETITEQTSFKVFKIAETEKYAHVTYFFNGGAEESTEKEVRVLIPSPKDVATYDLKPEMSIEKITACLNKTLENPDYLLWVANFANPDMVGHTGNYNAAKKAVAVVDSCIHTLLQTCLKNNIYFIITADHGNVDQMIHPDGSPHTAHTTSKVPFLIVHPELYSKDFAPKSPEGPIDFNQTSLKDVAPTILKILQVSQPKEMTGKSIAHFTQKN